MKALDIDRSDLDLGHGPRRVLYLGIITVRIRISFLCATVCILPRIWALTSIRVMACVRVVRVVAVVRTIRALAIWMLAEVRVPN